MRVASVDGGKGKAGRCGAVPQGVPDGFRVALRAWPRPHRWSHETMRLNHLCIRRR
ncbi:hypothetical protein BCAR13_980013 [Paraburkholderia caribensis]|nr:hypothetical protein BCAR13_980013 [Paraburkholderia caribensis]